MKNALLLVRNLKLVVSINLKNKKKINNNIEKLIANILFLFLINPL